MSKLTVVMFFCCITFIREAKSSSFYNNLTSSDTCNIDAQVLPIDQNTKDDIVDTLNRLRNFVASGKLNGFSSASRMFTVTWDDKLHKQARDWVQKCDLHRHNIKTFGETIGYYSSQSAEPNLRESLKRQFKLWFEEHNLASMQDILDAHILKDMAPYNFLQLVYENVTKVGCAALKQSKNRWHQMFITCIYNDTPKENAHVYKTSNVPGKDCSNLSKVYKYLCASANDEKSKANVTANAMENSKGNSTDCSSGNSTEPTIILDEKAKVAQWNNWTDRYLKQMELLLKNSENEEIVISTFNLPYFPVSLIKDN